MANQERIIPSAASIAPWLSVSSAAKALEFYKAAFGAAELYRLEEEEGRPLIAELAVGGASFWVQEDSESRGAGGSGGGPVRMILTVNDPDGMHRQALMAGANEIMPVGEGHGWRIGRIADPFGYHWEIGCRLE
ncbi:VOC family protein [Paenibacillus sacheonensis]|uniref:VOC family protein n=1 Tax=Paenibacillus sacheonensis TaxID=742054 RepID=A0A7X4YMU6_9BACL|nr:VOC family protein [Paenibacillus sacheonensis]MBM7563098.1 PhnB protein [Paenibacillus sacheonensis]NBC68334.1 VOC family protein [Paenibacillus sacheonensis]